MPNCPHCQNGHFHGTDVECINGVLIDVDVAHEGWQRDVNYPAAPCGSADSEWPEDDRGCQARLEEWAFWGAAVPEPDPLEAMRCVGIQHGLVSALVVLKIRLDRMRATLARIPPHHAAVRRRYADTIAPLAEARDEIDKELRNLQAGNEK